jgi:hypothetical protein
VTLDSNELAAREAIRDLVSRYCTCADAGRLDDVIGLFTADGLIEFGGAEHVGAEGIRGMFVANGARLRASGIRPGRVLHLSSTLTIDLDGPDAATAQSYFTVMSGIGVDHWGRYRDQFAVSGGGWRFGSRVISVDGFAPGGVGEVLSAGEAPSSREVRA